jgi:hypothetical protein
MVKLILPQLSCDRPAYYLSLPAGQASDEQGRAGESLARASLPSSNSNVPLHE